MSTDQASTLRLTSEPGVLRITLDDPRTRNALSVAMLVALRDAIGQAESDPKCRAVVIDANGPIFCRGLDLDGAIAPGQSMDALARLTLGTFDAIAGSTLPVVACVQGEATGGGVGLAAACDVVIAEPAASFTLPEVVIGLVPALIAPFLLRRVSPGRLRALAVSSRALSGSDACAAGLVDELAADAPAAVARQVKRLLRSSPAAIAATKQYLDQLVAAGPGEHRAVAGARFADWTAQSSVLEVLRAFAAGDSPPWFHPDFRKGTDIHES